MTGPEPLDELTDAIDADCATFPGVPLPFLRPAGSPEGRRVRAMPTTTERLPQQDDAVRHPALKQLK